MICFLKFFFVKRSNNFFSIKIKSSICSRNSVFNFCNHFLRPIWNIAFCKNIFIFWYSNYTSILNLGSLLLISLLESMYVLDFTSKGVILILLRYVLMYYYIYQLYHRIYQYRHFFDIEVIYLQILFYFFESFRNNIFSFIMCWINFYIIFF